VERRILITGGDTGNLGMAAYSVFAENGWSITTVGKSTGLDLTDWEATDVYANSLPQYDVILMAHGTAKNVLISESTKTDWCETIGNNLESAFVLSSALLRQKKLNSGALVVYCSSIQATQPRTGRSLYAIAKIGLEALSRGMAVELAPYGRAMTLRLGQMTDQMAGIQFSEDEQQAINAKTPLAWVSFEDAARFVLNLYEQPSLSGETIEISSLHKFSVWPE